MEQDGERTPLTATQTPAHHPPPPRRRARRRGNQSSYSATREVAGAFLVACSAACFSMMALLVRVGVVFKENRFASFQLVLSRSLFQFFAASIVLLWIKKDPLGPPDMRIWLVIRALAGGFGVVCLFYSLSLLSLGECTVLIFTMPIFTLIFSRIFLGEKVEVVDGFFGVLCLCGIALVAKPHLLFAHEVTHEMKKRLLGTGAAILAALAQASIYIVIKKMGVSVHYMMNVMYLGILGIVLAPIGGFVFGERRWHMPNAAAEWLVFLGVGFFGLLAQVFISRGLQLCRAGLGAAVTNLQIVFSFIFGIVFLDEIPSGASMIGAIIIVTSTLGVVWNKTTPSRV